METLLEKKNIFFISEHSIVLRIISQGLFCPNADCHVTFKRQHKTKQTIKADTYF
jgi:hypothetical protein